VTSLPPVDVDELETTVAAVSDLCRLFIAAAPMKQTYRGDCLRLSFFVKDDQSDLELVKAYFNIVSAQAVPSLPEPLADVASAVMKKLLAESGFIECVDVDTVMPTNGFRLSLVQNAAKCGLRCANLITAAPLESIRAALAPHDAQIYQLSHVALLERTSRARVDSFSARPPRR
jgi:hypothetical protein